MSSDSDELDPDEPRTPMWLPLLGSALFLVALMLFLATSSDDETKAEAEPIGDAQAANADAAGDDQADDGDAKEKPAPDDKPAMPLGGAKDKPLRPRLDAMRAPPPRNKGGKMVPSPAPSIRVRRIE